MKFKTYLKFSLILILLLVITNINSVAAQAEPNNPIETIDFAVITPAENPPLYEAAQAIASDWEKLGFITKITARPFNVHNTQTREEPWPFSLVFFGWGSRPERLDPNTFLFMPFHSSQAASGGENRIGFMNDEYDRIVDEQAKEMDINKRKALVFKAQEILADEAVCCALWFQDVTIFYNKDRFKNFAMMPGEGIDNEWSAMQVEPVTDDKTLRVGTIEEPDILNPLAMTSTREVAFARLIFDRLVRLGPDGDPKPHMAESWNFVSDTVIDFNLREGLKWHDGVPVTAEDVVFTFNYYKKWTVAFFKPWIDPIKKVTALGPLTVRFELHEPFAPFIGGTLGQLFIIPEHIWKDIPEKVNLQHPDEWVSADKAMIGSGPFKFEHWRRGEEILISKNQGYFMEPKIDNYLLVMYGNSDTIVGALEMGQLDTYTSEVRLSTTQIEQLTKVPQLEETNSPSVGFQYLAFNARRPPFDSKALRKALMHAIDYDLFIDTIFAGRATPGGPGMIITPTNKAWYNPNIDIPSFNLSKTRELLSEAGYRWDSEGRIHYPEDK